MPRIIDYQQVVAQAQKQQMRSLYHNSGAFGLREGAATFSVGWIGPSDPTIRPAAQALTRTIGPPYEANLAAAFRDAWLQHLPGSAWLLPKSSWMYELDFGSAGWLPAALRDAGVDPQVLSDRHDGSAIEFQSGDVADVSRLHGLVATLLTNLLGGDFALMFPDREIVATVHHHKQMWWTTSDEALIGRLNAVGSHP